MDIKSTGHRVILHWIHGFHWNEASGKKTFNFNVSQSIQNIRLFFVSWKFERRLSRITDCLTEFAKTTLQGRRSFILCKLLRIFITFSTNVEHISYKMMLMKWDLWRYSVWIFYLIEYILINKIWCKLIIRHNFNKLGVQIETHLYGIRSWKPEIRWRLNRATGRASQLFDG